ncbi:MULTISPECIES: TetR/AcrR family transcriptional regulator [Microbacterium]|jgi:AcrR family transcriptional regulator|uniref:TetR/AcrR family transcriptional regulator n=1 Tax=Microbacterium TaxID=33882 RepID=UPI0023DB4662|nr:MULTISPECIES: TetR/AcrR family transcriptional regulator [Microbacterium]MDF2046075.1 TetR/AcrR family transcriptional regulator [Microbacterium sp. Kw_RZR3]MDF2506764.1 hypothetical protein [Microbacterium sp.]MDQ1075882.1 AcrR family transcriptional regulator [Microbacterium sp. SORGH_AS_0969]MDQ1116127.1 AcrR family transcriptional regulator [Microbacterium testaceum]
MGEFEGDARQAKSRARLHTAVLEAAASTPIRDVKITDVASRAGVGRATFYRHSPSPEALLEEALRSELDDLRDAGLRGDIRDPLARRLQFEATLMKVVGHVVHREAVYAPALLFDKAPGVTSMLIRHVHDSVILSQKTLGLDTWNGGDAPPADVDPEFFAEAAANGFAHLFVGVLTSWLRYVEDRNPRTFLRVFNTVAPHWWLTSDAGITPLDDLIHQA